MSLYELAVMGNPSAEQIDGLVGYLTQAVDLFGLRLHQEVAFSICPTQFHPPNRISSAVAFFGGAGVSDAGLSAILRAGISVLPIASSAESVKTEIPSQLQSLNCMIYGSDGPQRIAMALLECVGLLPRQRRIFLSYRRGEARGAALQLFDVLSSRLFDVFLDTHGIAPAEDFQTILWHRLCDSDVLVMLDTDTYFDSRWTSAEFGRALAKGISVLRIGWPSVRPSARTLTASQIDLTHDEVDIDSGRIADEVIDRICTQLEIVRSQSHAIRGRNLISKIQNGVECIQGQVTGVGLHNAIHVTLPDGRKVVVYPTVGIPTSVHLNQALDAAPDHSVAVAYDHVGLHQKWARHLDWLGENIKTVRWIKADEAAYILADW
jgi:hypothetical protein